MVIGGFGLQLYWEHSLVLWGAHGSLFSETQLCQMFPHEIPPPGRQLEVGTRMINLRNVLFLSDFTLLDLLGC